MMEGQSRAKLTKGDSVRGVIGALATLVAISLALSPRLPGHGPGPQIAAVVGFGSITAICISTAKSKGGIALGILLVVAFRSLIAGIVFVTGAHGGR